MISTEPSIKEVISRLLEKDGTLLEDIDDSILFVEEKGVYSLKERVYKIMNPNSGQSVHQ